MHTWSSLQATVSRTHCEDWWRSGGASARLESGRPARDLSLQRTHELFSGPGYPGRKLASFCSDDVPQLLCCVDSSANMNISGPLCVDATILTGWNFYRWGLYNCDVLSPAASLTQHNNIENFRSDKFDFVQLSAFTLRFLWERDTNQRLLFFLPLKHCTRSPVTDKSTFIMEDVRFLKCLNPHCFYIFYH